MQDSLSLASWMIMVFSSTPWESCRTPSSLSRPLNTSSQGILDCLEELEVFQTYH